MKKQKKPKKPLTTQLRPSKMGRGMGLVSLVWELGVYFNNRHVAYNLVSLTSFAVYSMVMMMMTHCAVGQSCGSGRHSSSSLQVGCFHSSH